MPKRQFQILIESMQYNTMIKIAGTGPYRVCCSLSNEDSGSLFFIRHDNKSIEDKMAMVKTNFYSAKGIDNLKNSIQDQ